MLIQNRHVMGYAARFYTLRRWEEMQMENVCWEMYAYIETVVYCVESYR